MDRVDLAGGAAPGQLLQRVSHCAFGRAASSLRDDLAVG